MKILITSGGTKVPIDPVRDITNMSNGTFGAKIATEILQLDHEVIFFTSERGLTPFKYEVDFYTNDRLDHKITNRQDWCNLHRSLYTQERYRNYDDYKSGLETLIFKHKPDVIVLAAAVSDYVAIPKVDKIKSSEDLTIKLHPADKIISNLKKLSPSSKLVGFKLLVSSTEAELLSASWKSIVENQCDLIVANDLTTLKSGNHEVILVKSLNGVISYSKFQKNIASHVAAHILALGDNNE